MGVGERFGSRGLFHCCFFSSVPVLCPPVASDPRTSPSPTPPPLHFANGGSWLTQASPPTHLLWGLLPLLRLPFPRIAVFPGDSGLVAFSEWDQRARARRGHFSSTGVCPLGLAARFGLEPRDGAFGGLRETLLRHLHLSKEPLLSLPPFTPTQCHGEAHVV